MSYQDEQTEIEGRMITQWALIHNDIKVIYENSPEAVPTSGSWLHFEIHGVDSDVTGIGGSATQHTSTNFISIIVSVEKGTGSKTAKGLADDAAAIFRGAEISGYLFKSPWIKRLGNQLGWFRYAVTIPFERSEIFN